MLGTLGAIGSIGGGGGGNPRARDARSEAIWRARAPRKGEWTTRCVCDLTRRARCQNIACEEGANEGRTRLKYVSARYQYDTGSGTGGRILIAEYIILLVYKNENLDDEAKRVNTHRQLRRLRSAAAPSNVTKDGEHMVDRHLICLTTRQNSRSLRL